MLMDFFKLPGRRFQILLKNPVKKLNIVIPDQFGYFINFFIGIQQQPAALLNPFFCKYRTKESPVSSLNFLER